MHLLVFSIVENSVIRLTSSCIANCHVWPLFNGIASARNQSIHLLSRKMRLRILLIIGGLFIKHKKCSFEIKGYQWVVYFSLRRRRVKVIFSFWCDYNPRNYLSLTIRDLNRKPCTLWLISRKIWEANKFLTNFHFALSVLCHFRG